MVKGAENLGIDRDIAQRFATQTALGALTLAHQSQQNFSDLIQSVTSPKGTTEAALNELNRDKSLEKIVHKAMKAAYNRAISLGQTNLHKEKQKK